MWQGAAAARYGIGLDLGDLGLRDALVEALAGAPALRLASGGAADAVVSDRAGASGARLVRIGDGPLPEDAGPALILAAAHLVAAGLRIEAREPEPVEAALRLSPREREVLALLVEGAPNKVIALTLGIAVRTAKFHVAAILVKLGARNRGEAVAMALREGLILL